MEELLSPISSERNYERRFVSLLVDLLMVSVENDGGTDRKGWKTLWSLSSSSPSLLLLLAPDIPYRTPGIKDREATVLSFVPFFSFVYSNTWVYVEK